MNLEFVEGFDVVTATKESEKYAPYVQSNPMGGGQFEQTELLPGRYGGNALHVVNTAFGEYLKTKRLSTTNQKLCSFNFRYADPFNNGFVRSLWLRFQNGDLPQMGIQLNPSGVFELTRNINFNVTSGPGIIMPIYTIPDLNWHRMDVAMEFASPGKVLIWVDGVQVVNELNINTTPNGTGCNAISRRWQNFGTAGLAWDDLYILKDTLTPLGPMRVITSLPTADFRDNWVPSSGTSHTAMVADVPATTAPDDDVTYIQSAGVGDDLFGLADQDCVGRIWGVALNAASKIGSFSQGVTLVAVDGNGDPVSLGGIQQPYVLNQYGVLQGISEEDNQGNPWNPLSIKETAWGVSAVSNVERVSQVYLEALVSLDPAIPFECGQQPYAY